MCRTYGLGGMTQSANFEPVVPADQCSTMVEVRAGVDQIDRDLVNLLAQRFSYMRAAARIKPERNMVRNEMRKAEVLSNVCAAARNAGIPDQAIADIWETLVEASIAYEMQCWDDSKAARG
jgi:isochorismate pyruvate lyase